MHLAGSPGRYFAYLKDCLEEWSSTYKLKGDTLAKSFIYIQIVHFAGISNIILILQQHDTHVVEVQQDKNHFKS